MLLTPGVRVGAYDVVALIGAGGMGEVYRARDARLGRDVAIKVLPAAVATDPDRLHRFEQEARAAAALNHPNILAVYDVGRHEDTPYIVSELLEGETLRDRLNGGALPVRKAVEFAAQIAHGLAAAHDKGIVHRDLKPENVFLTHDGRVKILDFGLAKLTQPEPALAGASALPTTPAHTGAGIVLGTMGYMSPEQVRGLTVDHRADIFAFGAMLFEMVSGRRAFPGATAADTISAILNRDPLDQAATGHDMPPALQRIITRCLEKQAAARFRSADDLAFALETLLSQSHAAAVVTGRAERRTLLQNARLGWSLAAASLLLAALATALSLRPAAPESLVTRLDVVTPPTNEAFSFALSPDGRQLVFAANGEKGSQLWLRSLDQAAARPLVGTEGGTFPFWAPDGRAIGFFADDKLKRLELAGGAPQVLADAPLGRGGTWNTDNVIVFAPTVTSPLMRVPATGGPTVPVTRLAPGQGSHRWPQFLPGETRLLFAVPTGETQAQGIYVAGLDGGDPMLVVTGITAAQYAPPGYLLRVSQSGLVAQRFDAVRGVVEGEPISLAQNVGVDDGTFRSAFSVSASGTLAHRAAAAARRQLVWVDRAGKILSVVGTADENILAHPALAPDGRRVAVIRMVQGNNDVWLMDVVRGVATRFTFDPAVDYSAIWSPDGQRVVFYSARRGAADLFEKSAVGATDEQPLLVSAEQKAPLDWSHDGRYLLYGVDDPKTARDLWALPMTGEDRKPFPILQTGFDETGAQFSPDGRWIAYTSNESGRYEVYIRSFPEPGGTWQVSTSGGSQPRWRPDGQELFYVAPDSRLMAVAVRTAAPARTVETGTPVALFPTRLATGPNIGTLNSTWLAQYAVAADGRFLMNVAIDDAVTSPITIVLNWTSALN